MARIEESIEVGVPVDTAYNQWTQFEEFPQFMEGVKHVRQLDDTRLRWVAEIAGQEASWEARITEQTPYDRIAWTSTQGKDNGGVVSFASLDPDRCRVTVRLAWESEGLMETLGGYLGADDRRVEGDLERFRELVEMRGATTSGWHGEIHEPDSARGDAS